MFAILFIFGTWLGQKIALDLRTGQDEGLINNFNVSPKMKTSILIKKSYFSFLISIKTNNQKVKIFPLNLQSHSWYMPENLRFKIYQAVTQLPFFVYS